MKVGVLQFFSWPERRVAIEAVYERALQRIEVMDRGGYDAVWLAEHHFHSFSVCPSVHMMGVHVAGRTQRLRIGTAVSLAAFYHPLRLAEEVALLDVLSGGRVNWGAGRGFDRTEFRAFGVRRRRARRAFRRRSSRPRGVAERAAEPSRPVLRLRRRRGAAAADAEAASAGVARGVVSGGDRARRRRRLHDHDGPALDAPRDRPQARALPREARGRRPRDRRPRDPDGAPARGRRRPCARRKRPRAAACSG